MGEEFYAHIPHLVVFTFKRFQKTSPSSYRRGFDLMMCYWKVEKADHMMHIWYIANSYA